MKCLIVLFAAAAVGSAQFLPQIPGLGEYYYSNGDVAYLLPFSAFTPSLRSKYHAQNEEGEYSFGYSSGPSSQQESSAGGITQGAFNNLDPQGMVQSRSYVSDGLGFRVAGTDIPVDANTPIAPVVTPVIPHPATVVLARKRRQAVFYPYHAQTYLRVAPVPADTHEVAVAKINHYNQYNYEAIRNAHLHGRKKRSVYAYSANVPLAYHSSIFAPVPAVYHPTPVVPAPAVSSQFHSQDELGQYSYGYANPLSSKSETRFANGVTQGGYSYVDAHGLIQSANYVADPANGFRVAATNLPVAPAPVAPVVSEA